MKLRRILCETWHVSVLSRLRNRHCACQCNFRCLSNQASLVSQLHARIKFNGPITVADYMKEVLTNPVSGYYIHRDVFGSRGDFTTSPEISQMFGELVAIWFVNEHLQNGSPSPFQLVELGPGRGTMADDMLRVFSRFPEIRKAVSLHLVEVSEKLSELQEKKLSKTPEASSSSSPSSSGTPYYKKCESKYGPEVYWYRNLTDVPRGCTAFVAHEFFDALPIHKFQKTDTGWSEVLVDMDPSETESEGLRFVLSPSRTAAMTAYLKDFKGDSRSHIEVCPVAGVVIQEMVKRIKEDGGCALIADYGHHGDKEDTFRGFKNHSLHDVLSDPGTADLTADVDFGYLRKMAGSDVKCHGPLRQTEFLHNMGIAVRLEMLLRNTNSANVRKDLVSGYKMLTSPEQMGDRFKFFSILSPGSTYTPAGFKSLT